MNMPCAAIDRSYLFVPADRPERYAKALASGADAVIIDLEDAVAPEAKHGARAALMDWAAAQPALAARIWIRINDESTPWFTPDLALLRAVRPAGAMLSKAESAAQVAAVAAVLPPHAGVIALIETARGVQHVDAVANAARVARLAFGTLDYALDLGLPDAAELVPQPGQPAVQHDWRGLAYPASRIAIASRLAGLPPPIAGVTAAINDTDALLADFSLARACGFGAKLCIHPAQIAPVHGALAPTPEQEAWALRVLAVLESGPGGEGGQSGAARVDGRMVDRPLLLKARALLARRNQPTSLPQQETTA